MDSITQLACYLKDKKDDQYTPKKIADIFADFSYQLGKLALELEYDSKTEIAPEAMAFKLAMRSGSVFTFPSTEELKDQLSHDSINLIQKTEKLSKDLMQLIDDVYAYVSRYYTNSAQSKRYVNEIARGMKALAIIISRCAEDITMGGGDLDGGFY